MFKVTLLFGFFFSFVLATSIANARELGNCKATVKCGEDTASCGTDIDFGNQATCGPHENEKFKSCVTENKEGKAMPTAFICCTKAGHAYSTAFIHLAKQKCDSF